MTNSPESSWQACKAAGKLLSAVFKRGTEKRSCPLKLILQQRWEGGSWGAVDQLEPRYAFSTICAKSVLQSVDGASLAQGWELLVVSLVTLCTGAYALLLKEIKRRRELNFSWKRPTRTI